MLAQGRKLGRRIGSDTAIDEHDESARKPMTTKDIETNDEMDWKTKSKHGVVRCTIPGVVATASGVVTSSEKEGARHALNITISQGRLDPDIWER